MSRLPVAAFAALVVATVVAFFVVQHLKVTTPLVAGFPAPFPAAINPKDGTTCGGVDHRYTTMSFYLLHRPDDVDVYVVDQNGTTIRTVASGRHMRRGVRTPDGVFYWDGRNDAGAVVPDGAYYFRIALIHQGRTIPVGKPVQVITVPPRPVVSAVSPSVIPFDHRRATIRYAGNEGRRGTIRIFRTDLPGRPRLLTSFSTPPNSQQVKWNGKVNGQPGPAGSYLVGLDVTDGACNIGHFPASLPPTPGSTPHAGLTIRYLAASPPLTPVPAGSRAVVHVDARGQQYGWSLAHAGAAKALGSGRAVRAALAVATPAGGPGLYTLYLSTARHRTAVPLIVGGGSPQPLLVVLPVLTWQGLNPVDDDGGGLPSTLTAGDPINLKRPLANGLPSGFAEEAAVLAYLDRTHHGYQLTSDLALAQGVGPSLAGHAAVLLDGSMQWLPQTVSSKLRSYVEGGGHVISIGANSLRSTVTLTGATASNPTQPAVSDVLGAVQGPFTTGNHQLILVIRDGLGIFRGTARAFSGFTSFTPITSVSPPAAILAEAGTAQNAAAVVGFSLGRGTVVEITLAGFGSSLAHDAGSRQLLAAVISALSRR